MWKFKASKFKNAAPKIPKKEEWVSEVDAANLLQSHGNHVAASAIYTVYSTNAGGSGSLGVLPNGTRGRQNAGSIKNLRAHADFVTDFKFSPFDDYCLATTSHDGLVKVWNLPEEELLPSDSLQSVTSISQDESHIEVIVWHPTAKGVIASAAGQLVSIYDVNTQQKLADARLNGMVQSASWRDDGRVLVTSGADKKLTILDPRTQGTEAEATGHSNMRDSRVVWLGNQDLILSSAFDNVRCREVALRDCRNLASPICSESYDTSTGVLIPLYDPDTGMLILAGKGDTSLRYCEVTSSSITQNSTDTVEQVKGLGMLPKRALDVMSAEVNRVILLSKHVIIPIPYCVPRKSYREFHEDLFPETTSGIPALTADEWSRGQDREVSKVSLNPTVSSNLIVHGDSKPVVTESKVQSDSTASGNTQSDTSSNAKTVSPPAQEASGAPSDNDSREDWPAPQEVKKITFSGVRQSKFRHAEGHVDNKSSHIDNVRNLSKTTPGESDLFCANPTYCAYPLGGPGGLVAVLKVDEAVRLPDASLPALQNGSLVMDLAWDPFNDSRLAIACDDAKIRIWNIPESGLQETLEDPDMYLHGHREKIYFVVFHPIASDILASGSYDMTVKIWDLVTGETKINLDGHTDTIFSFAWSLDGNQCGTVCKDGQLRVYEPRASTEPVKQGQGPAGSRGARILWACEGKKIVVVGFNKSSERQILLYDPESLSVPECVTSLDTSPAILVPFYDADSSTLFLTGRGERTVRLFEITEEPGVYPLTDFHGDGLHQALAFMPKKCCDVAKVEFAKALRLTTSSIEPLTFTVPRVKLEYFQDDLFPDTAVTWEPRLSGAEWFAGKNAVLPKIPLRPPNMKLLSEAPVEAPKPKKYESYNAESYKTDDEKRDELLGAMMGKFEISSKPLPQDLTEGVEDDEWDD